MNILVTGSNGFIGRNISLKLKECNHQVIGIDIDTPFEDLKKGISEADFIIHLAGINRPLTVEEFYDGNTNFTKHVIDLIKESGKKIPLIFSSSIQAALDNDYGKSKRLAETYLLESGLPVYVYRLKNVFGKWCRPNYNSALATFCYNIARDLPITIRDPNYVVEYNYIDDIMNEFIRIINSDSYNGSKDILYVSPSYQCSLGHLAELINKFKDSRKDLSTPCMKDVFEKKLYATYLSYLPEDCFAYELEMKSDHRGSFTEFLKTSEYGQVSVNIAHPGITKGNHYHHTKNEKFLTVSGTCLLRFRKIGDDKITEYKVSGDKLTVVDIPVGYTHSITNIGDTDSVTIMWANEQFDKDNPDTYYEEV